MANGFLAEKEPISKGLGLEDSQEFEDTQEETFNLPQTTQSELAPYVEKNSLRATSGSNIFDSTADIMTKDTEIKLGIRNSLFEPTSEETALLNAENTISRLLTPVEPPTPEDINILTMNTQDLTGEKPGFIDRYNDGIDTLDIVDFLFGGELAIMGIKNDGKSINMSFENMKQQWAEQPLWLNLMNTVSLFGGVAFPAFKSAKMLTKTAKTSFSKLDEFAELKSLGFIDEGVDVNKISSRDLVKMRQIEESGTRMEKMQSRLERGAAGDLKGKEWWQYQFDKRFANQYYKNIESLGDKAGDAIKFQQRLQEIAPPQSWGWFFDNLPGVNRGKAFTSYLVNRLKPGSLKQAEKLSEAERRVADVFYDKMKVQQQEKLASGFIDEKTFKEIGEVHIPFQDVDTPPQNISESVSIWLPTKAKKTRQGILGDEESVEAVGFKIPQAKIPNLYSPTLLKRKKTHEQVVKALEEDKLITNPEDLVVRGFFTDELLHHNFKVLRDVAIDEKTSFKYDDVLDQYKTLRNAKKNGFIPLDEIGGEQVKILKRMLQKQGKNFDDGNLPFIRKELFDQFFDDKGHMPMARQVASILELITAIHKPMKTALSIPTHMQNFPSNLIFMHMSGMNPFKPARLKLMKELSGEFKKMADVYQKQVMKNKGNLDSLLTDKSLRTQFKNIEVNGKKFNLLDELQDPNVKELIEESSFEMSEGLAHLEELLTSIEGNADASVVSKILGKAAIKTKNVAQFGGKLNWVDKMSRLYLQEDMVPKLTMYFDLRGRGFSRKAAVLETGRRLPMYSTVGSSVRGARKFVFPWATFPTEAARILKNNLNDNPVRTAMWLRVPQVSQSIIAGAGGAPATTGEQAEAKRNLPFYHQKPTTLIASKEAAASASAVLPGAIAGGVMGSRLGGVGTLGGAIAGGVGAVVGMNKLVKEEFASGDHLRAITLDMLPQASLFPQTASPDFKVTNVREAFNLLPMTPFSIMKPMIDLLHGQTEWGQEIAGEDAGSRMMNTFGQMIGMVSPPLLQKYMFRAGTPDVGLYESIVGEGGKYDPTNIAKGLIDTGQSVNPLTGKPGSLSLDFVLNNVSAIRTYASDPAVRLRNENLIGQDQEKVRSFLAKNMEFHASNGNSTAVANILRKVKGTFDKQYASDPVEATKKFHEYLERNMKTIGKHPRLRGMSKEQLTKRLLKAMETEASFRYDARNEMTKFLRRELAMRG